MYLVQPSWTEQFMNGLLMLTGMGLLCALIAVICAYLEYRERQNKPRDQRCWRKDTRRTWR